LQCGSYVGERAVAVVSIKGIVMDSGDKQIGISVIVEVANSYTHVVTCAGQPRLDGNVRKHTVSIVTKQAVGVLGIVLC
jgi:hypothetical protein